MFGVIPVGGPLFSASVIYTVALVLVCIAALLLAKWHDLSRLVAFVAVVGVVLFGARSVEQLQFHRTLPVVYEMPAPDMEAVPVSYTQAEISQSVDGLYGFGDELWRCSNGKWSREGSNPPCSPFVPSSPIEGTAVDTDGDGEVDAFQPNECKDEGQSDELIQWVDSVLASATPHAISCPKPKSCCPCGR